MFFRIRTTRQHLISVICCVASVFCATAHAKDSLGSLGMGDGYHGAAGVMLGHGSRLDDSGSLQSGSSLLLHVEGGGYFKASSIGNLAGLEGGANLGYDGIPISNNVGLMGSTPFAFDMWFGFPVTLLNLGDGKSDWLRLSIAPGMGFSLVGFYMYLKGTAAMVLPTIGDGE